MTIPDQFTANFYRWEQRGRGVEVFPAAVALELPFVPFPGHRLRLGSEGQDSGVKPTFFSGLANKVFRALQPPKPGAGGKLEIKRIGGRAVRIKHRETSPEERRKVEAEQIEVIAKLLKQD